MELTKSNVKSLSISGRIEYDSRNGVNVYALATDNKPTIQVTIPGSTSFGYFKPDDLRKWADFFNAAAELFEEVRK